MKEQTLLNKLQQKILDLVEGQDYDKGIKACMNATVTLILCYHDLKPKDVSKENEDKIEKICIEFFEKVNHVFESICDQKDDKDEDEDEKNEEPPSSEEIKTVAECLEGLGQILKKLSDLKGN